MMIVAHCIRNNGLDRKNKSTAIWIKMTLCGVPD
jgi:hypothetical protein